MCVSGDFYKCIELLDKNSNDFEFKDGAKQADEYAYDANGNLTKDLNAGVSNIQYNCLNLPLRIDFSAGGFAQYGYTMDGVKRRKQYMPEPDSRSPVTIAYCGNVVYEESKACLLLTDEGYVTLDDNKYHYYLKDHQGNNCVVIDQGGAVEETNHYYPFGGVFASTGNVQPCKYNGKEVNARKELRWYDYGARLYDAALGRFTTVDPLAEKYYEMNPYGYCVGTIRYVSLIRTVWSMVPEIYSRLQGKQPKIGECIIMVHLLFVRGKWVLQFMR